MIISYRRWQRPRILSFDLDDTLYDNIPVLANAEQSMQQWLAQREPRVADVSCQQWKVLRQQQASREPALVHDVTRLRQVTIVHQFCALGYRTSNAKQLADEAMQHFLTVRNCIELAPAVIELLKRLAQRYPLVALTNGNADVARLGLEPYFTQTFRAGMGLRMKPYPDLFDQAEQTFHFRGRQWLHIGDSFKADVAGALAHGWQSAWINLSGVSIRRATKARLLPHIELRNLEGLAELL